MTIEQKRTWGRRALLGGLVFVVAVWVGCLFVGPIVAYGDNLSESSGSHSNSSSCGSSGGGSSGGSSCSCSSSSASSSSCGGCRSVSAGNPVRLYNGEATESKRFLDLGGPLGMQIRVSYSSKRDYHSQVGHNWAMEYVWRLYEVADTNAPFVVRKGNAKRTSYEPRGDGTYISQNTEYEILTTDTNGNYVITHKDHSAYTFDTDGKLVSIADGMGAELRMSYNAGGKQPIVGRSLYSNLSTNMVVARDYQLSHVDEYIGTNATVRGYSFQYDGTGHITNIFDQASRNVSFTYSFEGELLEMRDPEGNAYTCTYDELGRLKTFVGLGCSDCVLVEDFYNAEGSITNQVQGVGAQGREMIVEYPSPAQSVATFLVKGPDGAVRNIRSETLDFTIDGFGITRLKKKMIDNGFGVTNTVENWYDAFGQVTQRVENGVARTEYAYDGNYNNVWSRQEVSPGVYLVRTNTYDANNNVVERKSWQTDQPTNFFTVRYEYDAQNRKTKARHVLDGGAELVEERVYDSNGQVTRKINPRGNATAYEYDAFGFLAREYDPSNTVYETRFGYDSAGNRTNLVDALGYETHFDYDKLGRKTREVNALGYENIWTFSGPSLVEEETGRDGEVPGRVAQYTYNGLNKRIAIDRLDDMGTTQRWMSVAYDSDGNVLNETNALGYGTAYTYDNAGHKKTELDPYGALTTYGYDAWGNVTSVVDAAGVETRMHYDYLGRLTNLAEAVGMDVERSTGYRYNAHGDRIEIVQPDGSLTQFAYDAVGHLTGVSGSRVYPASYTYDANGNRITATDARGNTTTNIFDVYNRRVGITYPDGSKILYGYDLVGNLISTTDGNANTNWFAYDRLNREISMSKPNASNIFLHVKSYNPWNQIVGTSNIAGGVTTTFYDRLGHPTNTVDAADLSLSYEYDALGQRLVTRWPNGSATSNSNINERKVAEWSRSGNITIFNYDNLGRRVATADSLGVTNTISYDVLGRVQSRTNALGKATSYSYDAFDEIVYITYANGKSETRQYDAYGKVTNHYGAGQHPISYQYDSVGNLTNMVNGNGRATSWNYDGRNRPDRKTYDDGSYYEYSYDENGNLASRRDAKGEVTLYTYNTQYFPILIDYLNDADVTFTYNDLGDRTSMIDGQGTNTWAYDAARRIVTNTQGLVGGVVSYAYDAEGNRTSMVVNGVSTRYGYDTAGRLASVSNEVGVFTYTWHPNADLVQAVTYPSGASETNVYDILRRLAYKGNLDSTGAVVSSFGFAYDPVGLRTNQTHADGSGRIYGYDDTRQLIEADGYLPGGGTDTNYAYAYGYDPIGNYTQVVDRGVAEIFRPNSLNQYTNTTTRPVLTYDLNGNLLGDSIQVYGWDQENRLVLASNANGRVEFEYDGQGWKVEQREYTNGTIAKTTRYLYDGVLPIVDLDGSNQLVHTITRGQDLSQTMDGIGGIGGLLALTTHEIFGTNSYYFFYDGNGNVVDMIDEGDGIVAHYAYGPFGNTRSASGPLAGQSYRFSSKESVDLAGLYYYGYRFFLPELGRWLNRDPKRENMDINLYCFNRDNPITVVDYLGLDARQNALECAVVARVYARDLPSVLPGNCDCKVNNSTYAGEDVLGRSWYACWAEISPPVSSCPEECDFDANIKTGYWEDYGWWDCQASITCNCEINGGNISFDTTFSDTGSYGDEEGYTIDTDDDYHETLPCDTDAWDIFPCPGTPGAGGAPEF